MAKVKICPHCHTENPTSAAECSECGCDIMDVKSTVRQESVTGDTESHRIPEAENEKFPASETQAEGNEVPETPASSATAIGNTSSDNGSAASDDGMEYVKICPKCGHRNRGVARICVHCKEAIKTVKPEFLPKEALTNTVSDGRTQNREAGAQLNTPRHVARLKDAEDRTILEITDDTPTLVIGREHTLSGYLRNCHYTSRRHAEITVVGSRIAIRDLDSSNGTMVNDGRIEAGRQRLLESGDRVSLGGCWNTDGAGSFTVEYDR